MIADIPRLSQPGWAVEAERRLGTTMEDERQFRAKALAMVLVEKAAELLDHDDNAMHEVFSEALSGEFSLVSYDTDVSDLRREVNDTWGELEAAKKAAAEFRERLLGLTRDAQTEKAPPKARLEKLIAAVREACWK